MFPLVLTGEVGLIGGVLAAHYVAAGARAFAFVSLYEGFGLPALEAMAAGTPVIASGCGALAEVAGPAALAVDPEDPAEVAAAIARLANEGELRAGLRAAGGARAQASPRQACPDATARVLQEAALG
ncbi:MAG TPA: glycosyltransferase [Terriglobales bacterium]|nr:glycosyltransferase [Terriglobales bacterium]